MRALWDPPDKEQDFLGAVILQRDCAWKNVSSVDDLISDASTVALALAMRCRSEYDGATDAGVLALDNESVQLAFRQRRNERAERMETFLLVVMEWRRLMVAKMRENATRSMRSPKNADVHF